MSGQLLAILWFFITFYLNGYFLEVISPLSYILFVLRNKQFRVYNNGLNSFISTFYINHDAAINMINMVFFKGPFRKYINKLPWQSNCPDSQNLQPCVDTFSLFLKDQGASFPPFTTIVIWGIIDYPIFSCKMCLYYKWTGCSDGGIILYDSGSSALTAKKGQLERI